MFRPNTMSTSRRSVAYPGIGSRFYLPLPIWEQTITCLQNYGQYHSEALVYWGGAIGGAGETLVTSLIMLNHPPQGSYVRPSPDEMRGLLRTLRSRDEKLVAQIHSHPRKAFHSWDDDKHATSFHLGFMSIVLPDFGQGVVSLSDCAVYEFRGEFEELKKNEVSERFVVQELLVTLGTPIPEKEITWRAKWSELRQKLSSIGFKRQ